MTFPLDGQFAREFAQGLAAVVVIEEKRSFLELHMRDASIPHAGAADVARERRMRDGAPLFPAFG